MSLRYFMWNNGSRIWSGNAPSMWAIQEWNLLTWTILSTLGDSSALLQFALIFTPFLTSTFHKNPSFPLNYVLLGTDAHTTHSGRATSASPTHRTYCSVPFLPSAVTAALYSSWEGREMTPPRAIHQGNKCSVLLLSSIKVHLHAEAKQSFSMHSFFVSTYILP